MILYFSNKYPHRLCLVYVSVNLCFPCDRFLCQARKWQYKEGKIITHSSVWLRTLRYAHLLIISEWHVRGKRVMISDSETLFVHQTSHTVLERRRFHMITPAYWKQCANDSHPFPDTELKLRTGLSKKHHPLSYDNRMTLLIFKTTPTIFP